VKVHMKVRKVFFIYL